MEHYEISGYGTVRALARQLGLTDVAELLSHTLGEEESADFLLGTIAKPIIQQATIEDMGGDVDLEGSHLKVPTTLRNPGARKPPPDNLPFTPATPRFAVATLDPLIRTHLSQSIRSALRCNVALRTG